MSTLDAALVSEMRRPERRAALALELARRWNAEYLLVFIEDPEIGSLQPAPGFPRTLPGGAAWHALLRRCRVPGRVQGTVAYPTTNDPISALGIVRQDASVLLLLGGSPSVSDAAIDRAGFSLFTALLHSEAKAAASTGHAAVARDTTRRMRQLAQALDQARLELQGKGVELEVALAQSARLNDDLRLLNETLEQRVTERTEQLQREVEERQRAERALAEARKMEALGQLTSGVAHDFNNLLMVVRGAAELLGREDVTVARRQKYAHAILQAVERGAALTGHLLAFGRRQALKPERINVNVRLDATAEMLSRTLGDHITVATDFQKDCWPVEADPNQLELALLNIGVNARDAMPGGGTLTLRSGNVTLHRGLEPQEFAMVTIADTGTGVPPELIERIFEPFFTTKAPGKGTGLGLSQVYGFARQSGGEVRVESAPGKGTAVSLLLPRAAEALLVPAAAVVHGRSLQNHGARVLLVEDNENVAELAQDLLELLGCRVTLCRDGLEALETLRQGMELDVLLADVAMPRMNGIELAERTCSMRPQLPILLTSGYSELHAGRGGEKRWRLISKPYGLEELGRALEEALGQAFPHASQAGP